MSLYPSLEDMKVDHMFQAQFTSQSHSLPSAPLPLPVPNFTNGRYDAVYPTLDDYMGLSLTSQELSAIRAPIGMAMATVGNTQMIAPLSSQSLGLQRSNLTHGIREVVVCKDKDGRVGLRVQAINKGVFIVFVQSNSPSSMVGLRFGDQILQINNENVAGFSKDKVHDVIRKSSINNISLVIRDRPFERTITLHKDSAGHVGFTFNNGKINAIVKDSSAARNGLLIDHNLLEVDGQNVVGLKDKDIRSIMESASDIITITIMPSFVYDHMIKQMATNLVKKLMDHSIPDI